MELQSMTGCSLNYQGWRRKWRDFCREKKDGALSTPRALQKVLEEQQLVGFPSKQEAGRKQGPGGTGSSLPTAPKEAKQVPCPGCVHRVQ